MGRRSERLSKQGMLASDLSGEGDVIQVVSRAFDVLRCFEGHEARLGRTSSTKYTLIHANRTTCQGRNVRMRTVQRVGMGAWKVCSPGLGIVDSPTPG